MLHIVKQIKGTLLASIITNFAENNSVAKDYSIMDNSEISEQFIKQNSDQIIKWLKSDNNKNELGNFINDNDLQKFEELLKTLKLGDIELNNVNSGEIIDKINNFLIDKKEIIIETKEKFGKIEGTFGDIQDIKKQRKNVNMKSFEKIVSSLDPSQLNTFIKEITVITDKNNREGDKNYFNPFNIGKIKDLFKSKGYDSDGFFGGEEVASLITLFENIEITQKRLPSLSSAEKLQILLDYNIDGLIDNDVHYYTKEKEFFDAIKNEQHFDNLVKNLGYNGKEDFDKRFSTNYYAARKEFIARFGIILDSRLGIQPDELLSSPNCVQDNLKLYQESLNSIEQNPKFQEIKNKDKSLADKIKFEGAGAILGSIKGLGVSFDIKELTNAYIDSIQFGVANGVFYVGIAKEILRSKDGKYSANLGLINFIPYVSTKLEVFKTKIKDNKDLFPEEIENGVKIDFHAGISILGIGLAGLDSTIINENTKQGMLDMKNKMSESLKEIFESIKNGKEFKDLGIEENQHNIETYNRLCELYKVYGNEGLDFLIQGALNNYERELYENAKGTHFTGLGFGIGVGLTYFYPVVGAHWEHHSVKWVPQEKKAIQEKPIKEVKEVVTEKKAAVYEEKTTIVLDSSKNKPFEGIEINNTKLVQAVISLDNTVTVNTRVNTYADIIMDPTKNLNERWEGFKNFANRKFSKKLSGELQNTISSFKNVLNLSTGESDAEKKYIISSIVQLMKKANDTKSGSLEYYNSSYEKLIDLKNKRRNGYKKLFGFDTVEESNNYDKLLAEAGKKGTISKATIKGISFDASSSLINSGKKYKAIKGVDVLYSNIQIITDGTNPILIPIKNNEKIDSFINTLRNLSSIDDQTKEKLIKGIKSGEIVLNYYSDPDGFDDRIIPIVQGTKKIIEKIEVSGYEEEEEESDIPEKEVEQPTTVGFNLPNFDTDVYGIGYGFEKQKINGDDNKKIGTNPTTTPGVETGGTGQTGTSGGGVGGGNTGGR